MFFNRTTTSASLARYIGGVYEYTESPQGYSSKGEIISLEVKGWWLFRRIELIRQTSGDPQTGGRMRDRVTIFLWFYTTEVALDKCLILTAWKARDHQIKLYPSTMRTDFLERWLDMPAPDDVSN